MGSGIEILRRKQQLQVQTELSNGNFSQDGVYGFNPDVVPYVPSSAPLPNGDLFSPKSQQELSNPPSTEVLIRQGTVASQYLPITTGTDVAVTFESGRPNVSTSFPSTSYTEIANSFIQAIINGEQAKLPPNIRKFVSVVPPRDSSGDRGAAANVASPLSNATPNTATTSTEPTKIRVNG